MSNRTAIANGADPIQQQAAADGNAVQDACNLTAVVGCFHRHLVALHRSGVCGDERPPGLAMRLPGFRMTIGSFRQSPLKSLKAM